MVKAVADSCANAMGFGKEEGEKKNEKEEPKEKKVEAVKQSDEANVVRTKVGQFVLIILTH